MRQVLDGEARPRVQVGDWLNAVRDGTFPPDSYVFHNVSSSSLLMGSLAPILSLWRAVEGARKPGVKLRALSRLGIG